MTRSLLLFTAVMAVGCSSTPNGVSDASTMDASTSNDADAADVIAVSDVMQDAPLADVTVDADAGFDCSSPSSTTTTLVGTPSWQVGEVAMYTAVISPFSAFNNAILDVVAPTHTFDQTFNLFTSAQAHAGPYGSELMTGLGKSPYKLSGCFSLADVANTNGIILLVNLVPSSSAPLGKSFEQPNGPVMPIGLHVQTDLYDDEANTIVDPDFDGFIYNAPSVYNDTTLDGHAHLYLQFGENQSLSPKPLVAATYRFEILLVDGAGVQQTMTKVWFKIQ